MKCYARIFALAFFGFWAATPAKAQFSMPKSLSPPKISTPKVPNFTPPKINTPKINTPKINTPKINTPKTPSFNPPKINTPKTPSFNPPKISTPKTPSFNPPKIGGSLKPPSLNPPKISSPKFNPLDIKIGKPSDIKIGKPSDIIKLPSGLGGNSGPVFSGSGGTKPKPQPKPQPPTKDLDIVVGPTTTIKKPPKPTPLPPKPPVVVKPNPTRPNPTDKIVSDILTVIPQLIPPAQANQPQPVFQQPGLVPTQPRPQTVFQPQPQLQPQPQQQIVAPPQTVVQPQPQAAPRNTIVTRKQQSLNSESNPVGFNLDTTQAETDARQEVEAAKAVAMLDSDVIETIKNMPDGPKKEELLKDWQEVVRGGGKTEAVQAFLEKHGPNGNMTISAETLSYIEMRQELSTYADNLRTGAFTSPEERDQALADLQTSLTTFGQGKNPAYVATLQEKMTNMQNFNTLGKLAVAVQESENPYPILVQGATQADMPLAFVSEMTGYPVMGVEPIAEQQPTDSFAAAPMSITIANPEANAQAVAYRLSKYDYSMNAGDQQTLDRSYVLSFDNGSGAQKSYTLTEGYYEWRLDPQGAWDLYKTKVTVVIDNSRYEGPFQYLLQGEPQSIAPGEIVEFSHDNLIDVAFHSGREGIEHFKRLKPGVYIVGLDPAYGALDLFPAAQVEAFEAKQPPYLASTEVAGSRATKAQRVQTLLSQIKKQGDQAAAKNGAGKPSGNSAAKKGLSPLGKKAPAASTEDLLKSIKPKAASGDKPTADNLEAFQFTEGLPGGPLPVNDKVPVPAAPVPEISFE